MLCRKLNFNQVIFFYDLEESIIKLRNTLYINLKSLTAVVLMIYQIFK